MNYMSRVGGFVAACLLSVVIQTLLAPPAHATGESYRYDAANKKLRASGGSYLNAFGLTGDAVFSYDDTAGYSVGSSTEVYYFEKTANILGNNCGNGIAYVAVYLDTNSKKTTQVVDGCGYYSARNLTRIKDGLLWDQTVSYTTFSSGGGSSDISGTPTYTFNSTDSKYGTAIKACGGFYKQFNAAGCLTYSLAGDTGTVNHVGNYESAIYYSASEQVIGTKACEIRMYIAISDVSRTITDNTIPGYVGYALFVSSNNVTNDSSVGTWCSFVKPSNHTIYTKSPGLAISITGADTIESINGESVEKDADAASTCGVDEVGWAVCPLLNFIGKLNDMAFATLSGTFLETPSSLINDADTLAAWRNFRDIANALFIIAFLFMVYSQMAGGRG